MKRLSDALFREVRPEFFRVLTGPAARLYVDSLDSLERASLQYVRGIERDDAIGLIEQVLENHADVPVGADEVTAIPPREKARTILDHLKQCGWLEEEERSDWKRLIHFHPSGLSLMHSIRKMAYPEAIVFSDKLVNVCTTLTPPNKNPFIDDYLAHDQDLFEEFPTNEEEITDPVLKEPLQHIEACIAQVKEGVSELRGMQSAIERHTRQQLAASTIRENLSVLFDKFAEQIGHACYAELVQARLPVRLSEAYRRVEELLLNPYAVEKMQAEILRREPGLSVEQANGRVREKLDELSELIQSVVPLAESVDRRTAEFTRRSLARFRYLQETTSDTRAGVQEFFETLNKHFAGRRVADLDGEGFQFPEIRVRETRLIAGVESLYTPRLRRTAGEIEPLDDEATEAQQSLAMRRLRAEMNDSLTVARANRFVDNLLSEDETSIESSEIPIHCEEDLADLVACLLHARAADAHYVLTVPRFEEDTDSAIYDAKLSYRIERFTLSRK